MTDTQALIPPITPSFPSQLAVALTVQVLGSIVIHVLITLMVILFRAVLFAFASPGPPDLLDKAKKAFHACPPRAVPLIQTQTAALSQRVCMKVCAVFHKEPGSERALRDLREREKEQDRGGEGKKGGVGRCRGEATVRSQLERMGQISVFFSAPVSFKKACMERSSAYS